MVDASSGVNQNIARPTETTAGTGRLFGNQFFDIQVTFNNHNTNDVFILPASMILEMVLEEDLLKWPYKGYLVYKNMYDGLERINTIKQKPLYQYRMDARDEVTITIKPIVEDVELPPEIWELNFDLVIYDTEDPPASNILSKTKKVYFWDKRYQLMLDRKIQWSTATAQNIENPALAKDSERVMFTGLAIQKLLEDAGFGEYVDKDNWDEGATKILYTSPADASINDDLQHLLASHISKQGDPCLFRIDRGTGKWQLKPVTKFFDDAGSAPNDPGKLQIEHLFFEEIDDVSNRTTPFKAPISRTESYEVDIQAAEWSKITTYNFVDMSGLDNSTALVSKPVHWYDPYHKQFGVDYADNEIENVKAKFKELYTDKLLPAGRAGPLFTLNKSKTDQYNVQPEFAYASAGSLFSKTSRQILGQSTILFAGLFLNECIHLRLLGSTHRLAGTFIAIDRIVGEDSVLDKKLCGQWFVVDVKHIWQNSKYVNDLLAIKVHSYEKLDIKEDID